MNNNKSPGSDGFSTEFFKFFWIDLKSFVVNSINFGSLLVLLVKFFDSSPQKYFVGFSPSSIHCTLERIILPFIFSFLIFSKSCFLFSKSCMEACSDHSMVIVELEFIPFMRGKGLWKFNNSLLYDLEYKYCKKKDFRG
jgi:hypothetical protein